MTMNLAAPTRLESVAEPLARYRFWMGHVVAAVAWTSFGIALAWLTVVLPRKAELTRAPEPTAFLSSLTTGKDVTEFGGPNVMWPHTSFGAGNNYGGGRFTQVRGLEFRGVAIVKSSEQQAFIQRLSAAFQAAARKKLNGQAWGIGPNVHASADSVMISDHQQYVFDGVTGLVEIWGVGRGDQLAVIVSVHEF
jgi:hypothetical protein